MCTGYTHSDYYFNDRNLTFNYWKKNIANRDVAVGGKIKFVRKEKISDEKICVSEEHRKGGNSGVFFFSIENGIIYPEENEFAEFYEYIAVTTSNLIKKVNKLSTVAVIFKIHNCI